MRRVLLIAQRVTLHPDPSKLPGGHVLQSLTDGIGGICLILCLIGLLVGAAMWALGSSSSNYQHTLIGKKACGVCFLAAALIGGAGILINFFYNAGQHI